MSVGLRAGSTTLQREYRAGIGTVVVSIDFYDFMRVRFKGNSLIESMIFMESGNFLVKQYCFNKINDFTFSIHFSWLASMVI